MIVFLYFYPSPIISPFIWSDTAFQLLTFPSPEVFFLFPSSHTFLSSSFLIFAFIIIFPLLFLLSPLVFLYVHFNSSLFTSHSLLPPLTPVLLPSLPFLSPALILLLRNKDGGAWHLSVDPSACLEPMLPASETEARRDAVR